jgi:hypothetical protein
MLGLVDESTPESARGVHYVIGAAVLLDGSRRDEVRDRALKIVGDRLRPFHWRDEGVQKRAAMIELLGELEVCVSATIHHPVASKRQSSARRALLSELASMLSGEGVDELLIESRGVQDSEDRQTLVDLVHTRVCPAELSYRFEGKDDPLLWLPDAVAGLLGEAECRRADRWVAELQRVVPIFDVRRLDAHEPRLPS